MVIKKKLQKENKNLKIRLINKRKSLINIEDDFKIYYLSSNCFENLLMPIIIIFINIIIK